MLLTETFKYQIGTIKTKNGNNMRVAYIDAKASQDTYSIRNKIQQFGAKWEPSGKWWYWVLGNKPEEVINNQVRPCIEYLSKIEWVDGDRRNVQSIIDDLIAKVSNAKIPNIPGADNKETIKEKLERFKKELVNITSGDEFKSKIEPIIKFRNANNYQYSLGNIILILIQDPEAKLVKPAGHWKKYFNREVKKGAKPIMLWMPTKKTEYTPEEKEELTIKFLNRKKVDSVDKLSPADKEMLDRKLNQGVAREFDLMPYWYDYRFTEQMPNTEDVIGNPGDNIPWFEDNGEETPDLVSKFDAILEVINDYGIRLEFKDDLGGARGRSSNGLIELLSNQPKNAGMLNTAAHEFAHEILHQKYIKSNNEDMKEYFVGTEEGRAKVEQQAELCAWIVMRCFGYDMPTNINYVGIWGLNQDNAVKVFDSVSNVANLIVKKILQKEKGQEDMFESKRYLLRENGVPTGQEIANMVGCGRVYKRAKDKKNNVIRMSQNELTEMIKKSVIKILKETKRF